MTNIENILKALIVDKFKNLRQFSIEADLPYTTLIGILERGINKASIQNIIKICKALNIDTDALANGEIKERNVEAQKLTFSESSIIKKYRSLDGYGRKAINNVLDVEYERCNTVIEEDTPLYITKPYYAVGASAGNGEYLFDDLDKTSITLPDTPLNNKADLVIAVRGHSMEPTYYDGDKLLVKKQSELNIGDIGVFIINGESFVKELGKDRLISHNKQYQDIHCNDYDKMVTVGKVIGSI